MALWVLIFHSSVLQSLLLHNSFLLLEQAWTTPKRNNHSLFISSPVLFGIALIWYYEVLVTVQWHKDAIHCFEWRFVFYVHILPETAFSLCPLHHWKQKGLYSLLRTGCIERTLLVGARSTEMFLLTRYKVLPSDPSQKRISTNTQTVYSGSDKAFHASLLSSCLGQKPKKGWGSWIF